MSVLLASRTAQGVMEAEFKFNFDDTMVPAAGGTAVDFGLTNIAATAFDIIGLPPGSVVLGGTLTVETAFDTAAYAVIIGDSASTNRYLSTADRKALGHTALVPTGYRNVSGLPIRITITNTDVCTTGVATVRVQYVVAGRSNEVV